MLDEWCYKSGVSLDLIRPNKPVENGTIESFDGRLGDECLYAHEFETINEARAKLNEWQGDFNHRRPEVSRGHLPLSEYARRGEKSGSEVAKL